MWDIGPQFPGSRTSWSKPKPAKDRWGRKDTKGGRSMKHSLHKLGLGTATAIVLAGTIAAAQAAWEPTRTVEIIVPAGTGGGADQMARVVQGIVTKHNLMKQPMVVINKAGGAGGEGFLDVKAS